MYDSTHLTLLPADLTDNLDNLFHLVCIGERSEENSEVEL